MSLSQTCAATRTHVQHTICEAALDECKLFGVPDKLGLPNKAAGKISNSPKDLKTAFSLECQKRKLSSMGDGLLLVLQVVPA